MRPTDHTRAGAGHLTKMLFTSFDLQLVVDWALSRSTGDSRGCRPGELQLPFCKGLFYPILDGLRWNFSYSFLTHLTICEDVLSQRRSSRLFWLYRESTSLNLERHKTTGYLLYNYARRLFILVSRTLIPFVD